jgi:hypothetical protein
MEIIFFDYYHPYAGLCNQLYLITNHIHNACCLGKKIYIHKFNVDILKKNRQPFCDLFDIEKTNERLKKLTGYHVISSLPPEIIKFIPKLRVYPVSDIAILNCLEFNENILKKVKYIKPSKNYYSIHFRLETDCILHYAFPKNVYDTFMDLVNTDEQLAIQYFETLDKQVVTNYCEFLMKQYLEFVMQIGFDKPWYICTAITKNKIHDYFNVYLNKLKKIIVNNGGEFFGCEKLYAERELNALVDLLVLRDSQKMIGFTGSSFSEGYCYKVNEIRKVTQQFLFVKEK